MEAHIGYVTHGVVSLCARRRVLEHHGAIAVVGIGKGEGIGWKTVEKRFLGLEIGIESLMIVEMVACDIGKYATGKAQPRDAVLVGGMAAHLHRRERAPGVHHGAQTGVERYRVGGGMVGLVLGAVDFHSHRREQAGPQPAHTHHIVKQRGDGGLAVGACHAHEAQLLGGVAVDARSHKAERHAGVGHFHRQNTVGNLRRPFLHHHGAGSRSNGGSHILVAVDSHAAHGHKHRAGHHAPGVGRKSHHAFAG